MRSVSRHVQLALSLPSALNDHYSPVKAADYIEQRLRPAIAYYRRRVPVNTLFRITMKILLLTAAVASSVLAKYDYKQLVTIATAFASMITAYSEFADAGRKVERCVHTCTPIGGTEDPIDALTGKFVCWMAGTLAPSLPSQTCSPHGIRCHMCRRPRRLRSRGSSLVARPS